MINASASFCVFPLALVEMEQKGELRAGAEDSGRVGKGEKQRTWTVRWCKVVDVAGRKEGLFVWLVEVEIV